MMTWLSENPNQHCLQKTVAILSRIVPRILISWAQNNSCPVKEVPARRLEALTEMLSLPAPVPVPEIQAVRRHWDLLAEGVEVWWFNLKMIESHIWFE